MAHRIEVSLEHEDARDESKLCDAEFSLDLQYEEGDAAYGADADGNRGINVPGYFEWCGEIPDKCSECGHVYTEDEKEELHKLATQKAGEYELPEPDYD
jgi:hypothetical protein